MTEQLSPITPPLELVQQWSDIKPMEDAVVQNWVKIATRAAQWGADQQLKLDAEQIAHAYQAGADQELEACCAEVSWFTADKLRAARRPKPLTLGERIDAELAANAELSPELRALLIEAKAVVGEVVK